MKFSHLFSWTSLIVLLCGCASYQLGTTRDPGFKTIYIENFKSEVDEPGLETLVTTTVIQQFQKEGTLVATTSDRADVILKGTISSFEMSPVRYSRANELTPTQANMSIHVKYNLTKQGQNKPYRESQATGSASFFIGSDLQSDKRQGIPLAAEKLGRNIVTSLTDGW